MKTISTFLTIGLLALAGCGDDSDDDAAAPATTSDEAAMEKKEGDAMKKEGDAMKKEGDAMKKEGDAMKKEGDAMKAGTAITASESDFGEILFDSKNQAIYIFENDPKGESACYDDCAEAWPPVLTEGDPKAGEGVDAALLGTTNRDDGTTQVTYDGQPLYFYAHEGPGEVKCHNVNLNGGFWWVIGPDGERRP